QGKFPATAAELRELPGIGRYTANAVASIAFSQPVPVVDGNVKRVLERLFAADFTTDHKPPEELYWQRASDLLDERHPGDFNQAMMELGATICLPRQPLCCDCPVAMMCTTRGPVARKSRPAQRRAVQRYALVRQKGRILLQRRPQQSSLMPGMWELPLLLPDVQVKTHPLLKLRHSITTTDYTIFVHATHAGRANGGKWLTLSSAKRLPLTGLARKILEKLDA
ncbi:MAG TPA: A/G-specific adenine glycosylase, partial [Candidatus Angelobacter sp.]|nr:A/G-specific adenine glycosylase [Candidatus Angelobacter sp.]